MQKCVFSLLIILSLNSCIVHYLKPFELTKNEKKLIDETLYFKIETQIEESNSFKRKKKKLKVLSSQTLIQKNKILNSLISEMNHNQIFHNNDSSFLLSLRLKVNDLLENQNTSQQFNKLAYYTSIFWVLTFTFSPWISISEEIIDIELINREKKSFRYNYVFKIITIKSVITLPFNIIVSPWSKEYYINDENIDFTTVTSGIIKKFKSDYHRDMKSGMLNSR